MNRTLSLVRALVASYAALSASELSAQLVRQPNITLNLSETSPPLTLSGTGAFSNLTTLTPHAGIVPYEPNVSFWSDYAEKTRWFSIPNVNDRMTFSADGHWTFPAGAVWVKHFELPLERTNPAGPRRRLETRFLVKTTTDVYGLTYKWRDDQTEADLVGPDGEDAFYQVQVNGQKMQQLWRYPARYECMECHTAIGGHALSFNTRQMNRAHVYGAQTPNQIKAMSDASYFTAPVTGVNNLPALARANDTSQSLEWRVRSYFAANCMQCHQPGGPSFAIWDARPTTRTDAANIINGMLNYNGGDKATRFVVPGDLSHSMAYKRLIGKEPRMPPLATNELDPARSNCCARGSPRATRAALLLAMAGANTSVRPVIRTLLRLPTPIATARIIFRSSTSTRTR